MKVAVIKKISGGYARRVSLLGALLSIFHLLGVLYHSGSALASPLEESSYGVTSASSSVPSFSIPMAIVFSLPFVLMLVLLVVASVYSWQALRRHGEFSIRHKNITKILTTKEAVNDYLAVTTHYLNTLVARMSNNLDMLLSLKRITVARAESLRSDVRRFSTESERLLVANQVSSAQSTNNDKTLKATQKNPLLVKEVWVPSVIVLILIVAANILFRYSSAFIISPVRVGVEMALYVLSVLLVAAAYSYREFLQISNMFADKQLRVESELYIRRQQFIPEAVKVTSESLRFLKEASKSLDNIQEAKSFQKSVTTLGGINQGLVSLQKFADFDNNPPLFDITTYARKSAEKFKSLAEEKHITIETKVDTGLVARIQPEVIRQLIDSLLENSIKFSDKEQPVTLSVYRRFNKIVIVVSDKGIGIPEHKLPSLLKPFSRGADSMQDNSEGVGLGLYADKVIVEKLGGTIHITSKLNQGTTTTVAIPTNYDRKANAPVLIQPRPGG